MAALTAFRPYSEFTPRPLEIIDTTLREGQHTSLLHDHQKYFFNRADKEEILRALIIYGVKFFEVFSPVVSPQERDDFTALRLVRDGLVTQTGYAFLLAHSRCHPKDIEASVLAGADGLNFYLRTSTESRSLNTGRELSDITSNARKLIEEVRRNYPHLILRFSGEDAFRTSESNLFRVYDEIVPLVDRLGMPDSVGTATPKAVAHRIQALRQRYPQVDLEAHFHDDRGFAVINALEAVRCGVRYVDSTVLGIGERSGITSLTALLFNLHIDHDYDLLEGYHLRRSYPINVMVADKLRKLVHSKEPVSLTNRTHTAGVHQNEVLYSASAYEAHPLDQFGVNESEILLGPLSGWNVIHYFLKEIRYYDIDEDTARKITAVFKERVYRSSETPEQTLIRIADEDFKLTHKEPPAGTRLQVIQRLDSSSPEGLPSTAIPLPERALSRNSS